MPYKHCFLGIGLLPEKWNNHAMVEHRFQSLNFHELANNSPLQIEVHNLIQNMSSVELACAV